MSNVIGLDELAHKFDDLNKVVDGDHLINMLYAMAIIFEAAIKQKIKDRGLIDTGRSALIRGLHEAQRQDGRRRRLQSGLCRHPRVWRRHQGEGFRVLAVPRPKTATGTRSKKLSCQHGRMYARRLTKRPTRQSPKFGRLLIEHFERIARS